MYISFFYDDASNEYQINTFGAIERVIRDLKGHIEEGENPPLYYEVSVDDDGNPTLTQLSLDTQNVTPIERPAEDVPLLVGGREVGTVRKPAEVEVKPPRTRAEYERIIREQQPTPVEREPAQPETPVRTP